MYEIVALAEESGIEVSTIEGEHDCILHIFLKMNVGFLISPMLLFLTQKEQKPPGTEREANALNGDIV